MNGRLLVVAGVVGFCLSALLLASSVVPAASAAEDPIGALMPQPLDFEWGLEALATRLEKVKDTYGISRFSLYGPRHGGRLTGPYTTADYVKLGKDLAALKARLAPKGISCGYHMMPTLKYGKGEIGAPWILESGKPSPYTACPLDPTFRGILVSNAVTLASLAQPPTWLIEDDYHYFGRGCFCAKHLAEFAQRIGTSYDRESLVKALNVPVTNDAVRLAWHKLQMDSLEDLAGELSRAVHAVSPDTRFVHSGQWGFPEPDSLRVAKAFAGKHRPAVRWWGVYGYGLDHPEHFFGVFAAAQWAREHLGEGLDYLIEADTVPHNAFFASGARQMATVGITLAMGYDGPLFWGLGMGEDALETSPDYLVEYKRDLPRLREVQRLGKLGRPVGIGVAYDPWWAVRRDATGLYSNPAGWYRVLNRLGFALTTAETPVMTYAGRGAFATMDDAALEKVLSGRVLLDGAAAEEAVARGFAGLIGLTTDGKAKVDFTGEATTDGSWRSGHFESAFHQPYGLDNATITVLKPEGAEELSYFFLGTPDRKVRPSMVRFANAKGGRVVTVAINVAYVYEPIQTPNVFNFAKRRLFREQLAWLGGESAVPVVAEKRANTYVLARDTPEGLFVFATNLSCDTRESMAFTLAPEWASGRAEILGTDGKWRPADATWDAAKRILEVRDTVPVFKPMALRIARRYRGIPNEALSFDLLNEPAPVAFYGVTPSNYAVVTAGAGRSGTSTAPSASSTRRGRTAPSRTSMATSSTARRLTC